MPLMDTCENDRGDIFLSTRRLDFARWRERDDMLAALIWGDPIVTQLTGGPFDPSQVRERLDSEIASDRIRGYQYWPLFHRDRSGLAGCCGLRPRGADRTVAELGFQLCPGAWGKGLASEAAEAVIAWAGSFGLHALIAGHHPDNAASKKALERLGFRYTHDELYLPTGEMEPCYRLSLSAGFSHWRSFR